MDFALLRFIQRTPRSIQKILPTGSCAVLCHELPKTINVRVRLPMEPARCDPDTCCAKVKSGFRSVDCRVFNRNQRFTKRSSPEGADTPQPWWRGTQPRGKGPKNAVAPQGQKFACVDAAHIARRKRTPWRVTFTPNPAPLQGAPRRGAGSPG
jgi:hypothetical protein